MAKIELFKGKSTVLAHLIDVEGWAMHGYKVKQEAYDMLNSDSEKKYVKDALERGAALASAKSSGEGE